MCFSALYFVRAKCLSISTSIPIHIISISIGNGSISSSIDGNGNGFSISGDYLGSFGIIISSIRVSGDLY